MPWHGVIRAELDERDRRSTRQPRGCRFRAARAIRGIPVSAAQPVSVTVPVVGLETEVDVQPPAVEGVLTPPEADTATWLDDGGLAGADSSDTVYLLGHSAQYGGGAFDPLVDREQLKSTVMPWRRDRGRDR